MVYTYNTYVSEARKGPCVMTNAKITKYLTQRQWNSQSFFLSYSREGDIPAPGPGVPLLTLLCPRKPTPEDRGDLVYEVYSIPWYMYILRIFVAVTQFVKVITGVVTRFSPTSPPPQFGCLEVVKLRLTTLVLYVRLDQIILSQGWRNPNS